MFYGVNGKLTAQPGEGKKLLALLLEAADGMKTIDSCLCYIVGHDQNQPDDIWVYEVWTSEEAHQVSLQLPVFQNLIEQAKSLIAGMEDQPNQVVYGGKTSSLE